MREVQASLAAQRPNVEKKRELDDLLLAAEKIAAHAQREVLLIDTAQYLARAPRQTTAVAASQAAVEAKRWSDHRVRCEAIARQDARLYRSGDPCGHGAILRDIATIEAQLSGLAKTQP